MAEAESASLAVALAVVVNGWAGAGGKPLAGYR
jgi:hypothetical protein